jgi:hypothetical protein
MKKIISLLFTLIFITGCYEFTPTCQNMGLKGNVKTIKSTAWTCGLENGKYVAFDQIINDRSHYIDTYREDGTFIQTIEPKEGGKEDYTIAEYDDNDKFIGYSIMFQAEPMYWKVIRVKKNEINFLTSHHGGKGSEMIREFLNDNHETIKLQVINPSGSVTTYTYDFSQYERICYLQVDNQEKRKSWKLQRLKFDKNNNWTKAVYFDYLASKDPVLIKREFEYYE